VSTPRRSSTSLSSRPGTSGNTDRSRSRISGPAVNTAPDLPKALEANPWKRASRFTAYSMALPCGMMAHGIERSDATRPATTDIRTVWLASKAVTPCSRTSRSRTSTWRRR